MREKKTRSSMVRYNRNCFRWAVPVIILVLLQGCPINTGTNPAPPTYYSLEINPGRIISYPGGGGLSRVTMTPGEDFPQRLRLSLAGDSLLGAVLSDTVLTLQQQAVEVTLFPDTAIATGTYTPELVVVHGDQANRFPITVRVVSYSPGAQRDHAVSKRDTFLTWLEAHYPQSAVPAGVRWFGYNRDPSTIDLSTWVFLSADWEVDVRWQNFASTPHWFQLRRRPEAKPSLAAKQAPDGDIRLVPVAFYEGWE